MKRLRQQKVLIQYGKAGEPGFYSCGISEEDVEQFVALDRASGGYPYAAAIGNAHDFKTVEDAQKYIGNHEGVYIRQVSITYAFEQTERLGPCPVCKGRGEISEIVDHDRDYNRVWETRDCTTCNGTGKSEL